LKLQRSENKAFLDDELLLMSFLSCFACLQSLQPTDPPIFEVTNVLLNETATQLALWGKLGISLIQLPKRWGKDSVYEDGKQVILCT
jgi:nuclear pore complex protein Nup88